MSNDARLMRLSFEYTELKNLSDYCREHGGLIEVKPVNVKKGWPPEEYIVIFRCKGIAEITKELKPVYAWEHRVKITLNRDFPGTEPALEWLTPIWHPNILHIPPHNVCLDTLEAWYPGRTIKNLIEKLGDMVQYKHYHAADEPPFPLDKKVAEWVINFAEPSGILSKSRPVDPQQLLPEGMIFSGGNYEPEPPPPPPSESGIVLGSKVAGPGRGAIELGIKSTNK